MRFGMNQDWLFRALRFSHLITPDQNLNSDRNLVQ
jgi:hypothetical protein